MAGQRTHATPPEKRVLRHVCTACGGCCQGVRIPLYNDEEVRKVQAAAKQLGVDDPIDGRALRLSSGRCAFLAEDNRCRIHAELGAEHKPIPCRQFPLIAIAVGEDIRMGVDPASYGAWRSWRAGAPLPDGAAIASSPPAPGGQEALEDHFVLMCEDPQASLAGLLSVVTREPTDRSVLPTSFAARLAQRLNDLDLSPFIEHDDIGEQLSRSLEPLRAHRGRFRADASWPGVLRPEDEAWAIESIRRVIYLRLLPQIPSVSVAALLLLSGAVACSWACPTPETFHRSWTGWIRALRFEVFWKHVAGDAATLMWLGTGQRP
jgi:Fe-S-cluster containining protein